MPFFLVYITGPYMPPYTIAAFYKFTNLNNLPALQEALKALVKSESLFGTILLAEEGINGTIAGAKTSIEKLVAYLHSHSFFSDLEFKFSYSTFIPFRKAKILIKKEIVTLGIPKLNPEVKTGISVDPEGWNELINDPDVIVIDTRNDYEVELGTFVNAKNPHTVQFRDFPKYIEENLIHAKDKRVAMFCTGGIRCEKASSYMLDIGFKKVYQLQGGILKYLEKMEPQNSLWQGKCFIFDERRTIEKDSMPHRKTPLLR